MPALIGSLFVSLTADFAGFQRNMQAADSKVASTSNSMRRNLGLTERSVSSFQRTTNSGIRPGALIAASRAFDNTTQRANLLRGALFATTAAFGGLGAALTSNVISRYLDTFTSLQNQIRATSTDSADLAGTFSELQKVAERSRSSLTAVATLYARLARASPGEAQDKIIRRVETINKALQLGGASAQEAASAAIQFSQAIQSNRLGGDELRAVLETPLGGQLAKGLGVTIGQMRKMSIEGKLTADVVSAALDKISGSVDKQFAGSFETIDQALTKVDNKLIAYAGSVNDAYGVTKLLTGGIDAFGDNLGTIIPLVAQLGAAFGVIFASRLTTSGLGRLVSSISAVTAARRDALEVARTEAALAARSQTVAADTHAKTVAVNPATLAPKGAIKQYQRDIAALEKADANHLAILQQKAVVTQQLGEIYKTTTVGEIKAAQSLAAQQQKVNDALSKTKALSQIRNMADKQLFQVAGLQQQDPNRATALTKTKASIAEIEKVQLASNARLAGEETKLASLKEGLLRQNNAAYVAAAEQRAAILLNEKALTQELMASDAARVRLATAARGSKGALETAGTGAATTAIAESAAVVRNAETAALRASTALAIANREASALSIGFGLAGRAAGSFVGFLGGPWGAAITVAIGLMTYLGISAQETAQRIANARKIIQDEIDKLDDGKLTEKPASEALAVVESKIAAKAAQLTQVTEELARVRNEVADTVSTLVADPRVIGGAFGPDIENRINNVIATFRTSGETVDQLRQKLVALGLPPHLIENVIGAAQDTTVEFNKASVAVDKLKGQLSELNGQKVTVLLEIGLDQSIINSQVKGKLAQRDRELYGAAQEAAREATIQAQKRQELLAAAGDTGDSARNTPAKIAAEAQRLLEEGYKTTRPEAEALAKEELDLAENTRLANKAAKEGSKEFETFAHKLAELKETAAAAGLSDIDKQVVDFARSLKDGSKLMAAYIAAVKSGDLSGAPKSLLEARDAFVQIAAAGQANDIVKKYGEGAQVTAMFAQQQEILNAAVASGAITADQARLAFADFLGEFGKYDWINKVSDAFGQFADSALTDFDNIGDAFDQLIKSLEKTIIQATLIQPFQDWIKGALGQATSTANSGGSFGKIIGSLFGSIGGSGAAKIQATNQNSGGGSISLAAQAIKMIESGSAKGNYSAVGPATDSGDHAYGAYQVMGANIAEWTKKAIGKSLTASEFLGNPGAQDAVFSQQFGASTAKYGNMQDAASVWFSGQPVGKAGNASDGYNTVPQYVSKFTKNLESLGGSADTAGKSLSSMNDNVMSVTKSIGAGGSGAGGMDVNSFLGGSSFKPTPNGFSDMLGIPSGGGSAGGGGIGGIFSSITSGIGGLIKGLTDTIGGIFSSLFSAGGGLLSSIFSGLGGLLGFAGGTNSAPPGLAWVGENGPELMKMRGGEKVTPMSKLHTTAMSSSMGKSMGAGASEPLKIVWQDNVGVERRVERKSGPDGDQLMVMIDERVDQQIGAGRFDSSYNRRYGASPKITQR